MQACIMLLWWKSDRWGLSSTLKFFLGDRNEWGVAIRVYSISGRWSVYVAIAACSVVGWSITWWCSVVCSMVASELGR